MWVLTLTQPYAWMVVHGSKDLENRSWFNRIAKEIQGQGQTFAIHAGTTATRAYYREAVEFARGEDPALVVPPREQLVYGAILGTARIAGLYPPDEWRPLGDPDHVPWHMQDRYGWALGGRTPLPATIPWKGLQGFWKVDDAVIQKDPRP